MVNVVIDIKIFHWARERMDTDYGFTIAAERMYGLRMGTDYRSTIAAERMYGLQIDLSVIRTSVPGI